MKIAVASGKGGTGKTLVTTNLYYALQKAGLSVSLADCDAEEPNALSFFPGGDKSEQPVYQSVPVINTDLCTFCGRCHDYCNYNAIFILPPAKFIRVIEDLCHGCGACTVACQDGAITEKEQALGLVSSCSAGSGNKLIEGRMKVGVFSPVPVIKATVRSQTDSELILFDAPPGTSCPFIQTVATADMVILVSEPTPFGLSDLRQSVETLRTMNIPCGVVINRAGLGDDAIYRYLEEEQLDLLMEIPFSRELARLYSAGQLISEEDPGWQDRFVQLYEKIKAKYGNSDN